MSHWITRLKRRLPKRNKQSRLPIFEDDVFLISYPRSGNTWVRFLLANTRSYKTKYPVDFHSVHEMLPDFQKADQLAFIATVPRPRIFKSHELKNERIKKVIYLIRDGRDVMVSYFDFLSKQGRFSGSFEDFLQHNLSPSSWHEHVLSWTNSRTDILLVRYEDMLASPHTELARMVAFIGLLTTEAQLAYAVEQSSFRKMQQIEAEKGRLYGEPKYKFVRRGTSKQWENVFTPMAKKIFMQDANPLLLKYGYSTSPDW